MIGAAFIFYLFYAYFHAGLQRSSCTGVYLLLSHSSVAGKYFPLATTDPNHNRDNTPLFLNVGKASSKHHEHTLMVTFPSPFQLSLPNFFSAQPCSRKEMDLAK
jgi:hypothetical protein